MKLTALLLGGVLALSLGPLAFAQASSDATPPPGAAMSTPDFITAASQSDEFEIQEGQMAQAMGSSGGVKRMGAMMVRDHTMTTNNLHKAIVKAGMEVPPPPPLRPDQQQMVTQLQGLSGKDFDSAYVAQQIPAHQQALALHSGYAMSGDVKPIREAAKKTVPIVQHHLDMAQQMQSSAQ